MISPKYFWLFLILLTPIFSFAQANYQKGYLIVANGDSISGYINAREWSRSPKSVEFKKKMTDKEAVTYQPSDLKSFAITGSRKYITYTGRISRSAIITNNSSNNAFLPLDTTTYQTETFLRMEAEGNHVSLLSYNDEARNRLFIQEYDGKPYELSYFRYSDPYNDNVVIATSGYLNQLHSLLIRFKVAEQVQRKLEHTNYTVSDISEILSYINTNKKAADKHHNNGRAFIGGGINFHTTSFSGANEFAKTNGSKNVAPFFSAGYDFFQNADVQKMVFRGEVNLSYVSPKFDYLAADGSAATGNVYSESFYNFKQLNISISPQLLYNIYNTNPLKIYLGTGLSYNFSIYSGNQYKRVESYPFIGTTETIKDNYQKLDAGWFSFPVKAGAMINKKFELYAQYNIPVSYGNYSFYSIKTQTIAIGVHYCFNRN
ncbi:hypothetical protein GCM10027037_30960 [Mucilaginibacter koreensis]